MLDQTLLRIHREFSKDEKYKLLMDDYNRMQQKVENYKKETVKITEVYKIVRQKYFDLEKKYTELQQEYEKLKKPQDDHWY